LYFCKKGKGGIDVYMERTELADIFKDPGKYTGKTLKVEGWIRTVRSSGSLGFIEINDGTCFKNLQIVLEEEKFDDFEKITGLSAGTSIKAEGTLVDSPAAKQPVELKAVHIEVEGFCAPDYPLQKKRHSFEFLRTISHLRPRTNTFSAVFRVRSLLAFAIHKFFNEKGFVYVHTPIITGSDAEGAGEMFKVTTLPGMNPPLDENGNVDYTKDFFGKETNLTVSGQLNVETFCMAFSKVYTFGPTFRAENSNTARHASEFWMIEPEIAFASLEDDMKLAEEMIKYIIGYVMEKAPDEMKFFNSFIDKTLFNKLNNITESDFQHITYTEAVDILKKHGNNFKYPVEWGNDLQTEHERYLTENVFRKPVFVTDYPKDIKAFYMRLNNDEKTVAAMDLLVPGVGEIIGGSQREERLDYLERRIKELGIKKEDYEWYIDLRKYGGTKHAGFGLGFERAIMYMTGMSNIRDVIPFARTPKSAGF
jgi:asparaginyl-tRNA synthetase